MTSLNQGGARIVALHPIFTLRRVVGRLEPEECSRICAEIQAFVSAHGDENLIARSDISLTNHMRRGELVLLYEGPHIARRLVGVCVCSVSDHLRPTFELAYTAIAASCRGRGLACLMASAALVGHLVNHPRIEGIMLACRPSNLACRRAALKLGVDFRPASDLYPSVPRLKSSIHFHRHHHHVRNWTEEPLLGLVQPKAVRDGAWILLGASTLNGLAWRHGGRVSIDGEWNMDRDRDAALQQLQEMADGHLPQAQWWDNPPPPRVGCCA